MAEGGGIVMRIREILGSSPNREPVVPRVNTVEEAVKLTTNGTPHVVINGSLEPHKPVSEEIDKPSVIDPGNINNETILTDTGDLPVSKLTGFLKGEISNPNVETFKSNGSVKEK